MLIYNKGSINISGNRTHFGNFGYTQKAPWDTLKNTDAWVPHPEILMRLDCDVDTITRFFKAPRVGSDPSHRIIACIELNILQITITNLSQNNTNSLKTKEQEPTKGRQRLLPRREKGTPVSSTCDQLFPL